MAQYAATGCLNGTFYASADQQLTTVLELCAKNEPEFIAQVALFARSKGYMKDMPALLCAVLSVRSPGLLAEIFDHVIDSPKMLRNFVQIMRSGVVGRKSLGTLPKRLILQWLANRTDEQLFHGSVGNNPSLADVIKMVHHRNPCLSNPLSIFAEFRLARGGKASLCSGCFKLLTCVPENHNSNNVKLNNINLNNNNTEGLRPAARL